MGRGQRLGAGRGCYFRRHGLGNTCEVFLFCFARSKLVYEKISGTCKDVFLMKFRVEISCLAV